MKRIQWMDELSEEDNRRFSEAVATLALGLGHVLRMARKHRGFSIENLARRSFTSKQAVLDIELGRQLPRLSTLVRLSGALQIELAELLARATMTQGRLEALDDEGRYLIGQKSAA